MTTDASQTRPPTRWLSCHVDYACRHRGDCCRAGWPLPVEVAAVAAIDRAMAAGRLRTADSRVIWLEDVAGAPSSAAGTLRQVDGGCVFHVPRRGLSDAHSARHCGVHALLGPHALPASCQHYPRVCLVDDSAIRVSLSHYCETAATLLVDHDGPVAIVDGPPAVAPPAQVEGLDVRGELPPRLSDRVLMDRAAVAAWERHVVTVLAGPTAREAGSMAASAEEALARVRRDAGVLSAWKPGGEITLLEAVARVGDESPDAPLPPAAGTIPGESSLQMALDARNPGARWQPPPRPLDGADAEYVEPVWAAHAPAVRRYLAARAFGAWVSYQANATTALADWLAVCLAVLRLECARACDSAGRVLDRDLLIAALRQADLLLMHSVDPIAVARRLR